MATSGDPPLSDYDQTMALFLEFRQELRNWRKVVDLQHDGVTVFRCTFTFAQLMQPSIDMDIVRVDSFDELPDRSVQPGAAAFALSSSAPSGGPAAAPGGGWDETALSAPCGGAEFPAMTGSPDRDPDWDDTRVRMPGPPFLSPFGWKRPSDYRAIWGDADGNAPDPAETGPRPRMAFGRPWMDTWDSFKEVDAVLRQGIMSKMPPLPPLPPHLLGDTPEYTIPSLAEPYESKSPALSPADSVTKARSRAEDGSAGPPVSLGDISGMTGLYNINFPIPLLPSRAEFTDQMIGLAKGAINLIPQTAMSAVNWVRYHSDVNGLLELGEDRETAHRQAQEAQAKDWDGTILPPTNRVQAEAMPLGGFIAGLAGPEVIKGAETVADGVRGYLGWTRAIPDVPPIEAPPMPPPPIKPAGPAGALPLDERPQGMAEPAPGTEVSARPGAEAIPTPGGSTEIVARDAVNRSAFDRLNTVDPAINGFRPGEAGAAAELEKYLGGTLERSANPSVDFVFTSGKNTGQTVDFLLTPDSFTQAEKINRYFEQNLSGFADTLESHANAADLVPIDTRFLSESNQKLLENVISKLSPEVQAKIILFK